MTTSKTIAALLGPSVLAGGISVLINAAHFQTIAQGLSESPALIMIAGYLAFIPGLAIVYFHNRWTRGWPVLVTIMGWISLVVGLLRILFPVEIAATITKLIPTVTVAFPTIGIIFLLIGGFLSFKAFGRG